MLFTVTTTRAYHLIIELVVYDLTNYTTGRNEYPQTMTVRGTDFDLNLFKANRVRHAVVAEHGTGGQPTVNIAGNRYVVVGIRSVTDLAA